MKTLLGRQLTLADQSTARRLFLYRYTGDHKPRWASCLWKDGRLDRRATTCESSPTWPNNPELRKQYDA